MSASTLAEPADSISKSKPTRLSTILIDGKEVVINGGLCRTARLADEWYEDIEAPERIIEGIRHSRIRADIFTFWQRLPDTTPRYTYHLEPESIAALPVTTAADWFKKQLNPKTRNLVRKSEKMGVTVRPADFDDAFVQGMTEIFNESAVRQDKPFWHYGKTSDTIRREFSKYLFREDLFAAYVDQEMIGFIFLAYAGRYALLGQIISKLAHRDKAPNNALIARAVEVCASRQIPYLVYSNWSQGSLGHFKRQNGFHKVDLPRYYVPLTWWGALVLKLRLHHGIAGIIPEPVKNVLLKVRAEWYARQRRSDNSTAAR
jgi:hypothetical protein